MSIINRSLLVVVILAALAVVYAADESEKQNVVFEYKKSVTLDCSGLGDDVFVYNETSNDTYERLNESAKVTVDNQKVTIIDLRREEIQGKYSCRSGNTKEAVKREFVQNVGPYFFKPEKLSITITEGGPVELSCKLLYGQDSKVDFAWSRGVNESVIVSNEKYNITSDGTTTKLVISKVEDADKGYYNCSAKNAYGSHTEVIQLRVKDQLAALWPFLAIVVEVIVLCLIILIYEKKCNKKPSSSEEDTEVTHNLMGKDNSDVKKRTVKA